MAAQDRHLPLERSRRLRRKPAQRGPRRIAPVGLGQEDRGAERSPGRQLFAALVLEQRQGLALGQVAFYLGGAPQGLLARDERILRPLNYGEQGVPGRGWGVFHAHDGTEIAVINAQGRTYMAQIENPFTMLDALLDHGATELPSLRIVDFHCELTSEKNAFGIHLDGRVSAVCGTHTHVATADERILPQGTAYVSDIDMTGPVYSVIGFDPRTVLPRFINALPTRFEVGSGPVLFNAIQLDIEAATGRARHIARISTGDVSFGSIDYNSLFAVGLTLFVITLILNLISNAIRGRFREVYQ